ncbi:hypothetical protein BEP19_15840 [Ammoniphilus oxalaticus]|uniref:DUF2634 domain-containing protein n=1 Tax=Ammoniphilus oxalaticus TaxID=66863 RepID=A0A419SQJ8_9BACL|nr:DUF2634 domain-containing protein [Ammoniphilus oxalaticus]RKD26678.1 hypothetical protein BEP19_15840 [Ammoniphilus oxalaticus]
MSVLPEIAQLEFETQDLPNELEPMGKSFLFDFTKGEFVLRNGKMVEVEGLDALKVWIEKCMRTERYRFRVYEGVEYGVTLEDLIGSNLPRAFVEAEIKREVTESLIQHPYIDDIQDWRFERDGKWMRVQFRVITPDGAFEQEVGYGA